MKILFAILYLIGVLLLNGHDCRAKVFFGPPPDRVQVGDSNLDYLNYVRYITVPIEKQSDEIPEWHAASDLTGKFPSEIADIAKAIKENLEDPWQREVFDQMQNADVAP